MLVWLSLGDTCLLSAIVTEEQNIVRKLKFVIGRKQSEGEIMTWSGLKKYKSLTKEPNPKVPHLALPFGLGNEGHHAMLPKLSDSHLSYPY